MCSLHMNSDDKWFFFNFPEYVFLRTGTCELLASAFVTSGVSSRPDSISPAYAFGDRVQEGAACFRGCSHPGKRVEWI